MVSPRGHRTFSSTHYCYFVYYWLVLVPVIWDGLASSRRPGRQASAEIIYEVPDTVVFTADDPHVELYIEDDGDGRRRGLTGETIKHGNRHVGTVTFHWYCPQAEICFKVNFSNGYFYEHGKFGEIRLNGKKIDISSGEGCVKWNDVGTVEAEAKTIPYCNSLGQNPRCNNARSNNKVRVQATTCQTTPPPPPPPVDDTPPPPPPPTDDTKEDSKGQGDPHFTMWDGTHYSYHGACDMIFVHSSPPSSFMGRDDGLGSWRIHVRTEIVQDWSRIASAAIQIGEDILEVVVDGSHYWNGIHAPIEDAPTALANNFPLQAVAKCRGKKLVETGCRAYNYRYEINLGQGTVVTISAFKGFVNVQVSSPAPDHNFAGLMGTSGRSGMVDREGGQLTDPLTMGSSWQVRDTDPMIFHTIEGPQYPEPCNLPEKNAWRSIQDTKTRSGLDTTADGRRLRRLRGGNYISDAAGNQQDDVSSFHEQAFLACGRAVHFESCVVDVMTLHDLDMALMYIDDDNED